MKRALRRVFRALMHLYFQRVEVVGGAPDEAVGGRVFVSNHKNALMDPILVLTHTRCEISPLAKSTLWNIPGLRWLLDLAEAVPVLRRRDDPGKAAGANDAMFDKVAEHLGRGGNILIFPEGTSHNEPNLIRLKTGAARMLARAHELGARGLSFQAVGLEFDDRATFRSHALVTWGEVRRPFDAPDGPLDVEAVTAEMRRDLEALVVEGTSWEERRTTLRAAELFRNERQLSSLADAIAIAQEVERGRDLLKARDPALYDETRRAVDRYFDELATLGLSDALFTRAEEPARAASTLERALLWAALPLAPLGFLLYFLPYQLPRLVAQRSDEVDQHSTVKLGTGLVAYPMWAMGLFAAAWVALPTLPFRLVGALVVLVSPFAALFWIERLTARLSPARAVLAARRLTALARLRAEALAALARARDAAAPGPP